MPKKKSHYEKLRDKLQDRQFAIQRQLVDKHADVAQWLHANPRQLALGSLSSLLLLVNSASPQLPSIKPIESVLAQELDKKVFLISDLHKALPPTVEPLTEEQEENIAVILSQAFGFPVTAELNGKRLNRSYGLIGAEQHLMRYPGDTMATHFDPSTSSGQVDPKIYSSGMAPGRGAWGYFANSRADMTEEDVLREKYYIAVQTFLAPGFSQNVREYYEFFKYRKMLVVNPQNGKAMVVVIGDAGPAVWTGKHLGGSPEVMKHLERVDGRARGPVLYFFIDDPENKVPLGPIEI